MTTKYSTSMMKFSSTGASCWISVAAMPSLEFCRAAMSPAIRCEKNSMGRRSTCHKKVEFATMANLPCSFSR